MSDGSVSLEFLGEQMLRMQSDLRGVRSEQLQLESDQAGMRADLLRLEGKIENLAASLDVRFDQVNQTITTNLQVTLAAFSGLEKKIDTLKPGG